MVRLRFREEWYLLFIPLSEGGAIMTSWSSVALATVTVVVVIGHGIILGFAFFVE